MKCIDQVIFFLLLFSFSMVSYGQYEFECSHNQGRAELRERQVDFITTSIDVYFSTAQRKVTGKVIHKFKPLSSSVDSLWLDGPNISVLDASFSGKEEMEVVTHSKGMSFHFNAPLNWSEEYILDISYQCKPKRGLWFVGWDSTSLKGGRNQIWTQGQGINNRHWFPHFDHMGEKVTTETIIRFDSAYKVLSNGILVDSDVDTNGIKKWHYKMLNPHSSYLVMLGIGKYDVDTLKSSHGTTIMNWYYSDYPEKNKPTYRGTKQMVDYFEDWFDEPYPWITYSQLPVQNFLHGGMENTSATVFTDQYFVDSREYLDRNYVYVNAHEFVHQWMGNLVTSRNENAHWIHESFATYFHTKWLGEFFGYDEFDWNLYTYQDAALKASRSDYFSLEHKSAGSSRFYLKGAYVIHMLQQELGEELFRKSINHFLTKHKFQNVSSNDLLYAIHESTGKDLTWFWDRWIRRGGEPILKATLIQKDKEAFLVVKQQQDLDEVGLFNVPIEVDYYDADGLNRKIKVHLTSVQDTIYLSVNKKVKNVIVDPHGKLLKDLTLVKPKEMWLSQLKLNVSLFSSLEALNKLKELEINEKRRIYWEVYPKLKSERLKAELIKQLVNDAKSYKKLLKELRDGSFRVKQAILATRRDLKEEFKVATENCLNDSSYITVALALQRLCYSYPNEAQGYLNSLKSINGDNTWNIYFTRMSLYYQLGDEKIKENAVDSLIGVMNSDESIEIKKQAIALCDYFEVMNVAFMKVLIKLSLSNNYKLSADAKKVLKKLSKREMPRELIMAIIENGKFSEQNKKILLLRLDRWEKQ